MELCTAGLDGINNESDATDVWDKVTRPKTATEATGKEDVINAAKKDTSAKEEINKFNDELANEAAKTRTGSITNNK